jgi:hypothetical protein
MGVDLCYQKPSIEQTITIDPEQPYQPSDTTLKIPMSPKKRANPGLLTGKVRAESDLTSSASSNRSPHRLSVEGMVALHTLISNKSKICVEDSLEEASDDSADCQIDLSVTDHNKVRASSFFEHISRAKETGAFKEAVRIARQISS